MLNSDCINISIIPYGLRQEETIVQIANTLEDIDCVISDVFEQIEKNIQRHRQYLITLQKRSEILAVKVEKLIGKNMTTTVHSHYKFPAQDHSFDTLFEIKLQAPKQKPKIPIQSKFQHSKYNKTLNKLHIFHVKSNNEPTCRSPLTLGQGLGDIPPHLESLDSLLLFNTNINIYSKYIITDPLAIHEAKFPLLEEKNKTDIAAAPNSIANNQDFRSEDYFNCFYTPAFEEVPNINAPVDLPDLPGIAGDLKFDFNVDVPIAPSKKSQEIDKSKSVNEITISDLPNISDLKTIASNKKILKSVNVNEEANASIAKLGHVETNIILPQPLSNPETLHLAIPPPPPPPPPPPLPPPPPPPPPLPPPPPIPVEELSIKENVSETIENTMSTAKISILNDDMHANLMEAIRKAGGKEKAKLRQVSKIEENKLAVSNESNEDLFMTDLYAALARRRKGISGQIKDDKNVSMMDRVSAMIAPATPEESDDNSDDNANDWDE